MIDNEEFGVFFPQNDEYINTSDMVQMIASIKRSQNYNVTWYVLVYQTIKKLPGRISTMSSKAFGDSYYDMEMSDINLDYQSQTFYKSILNTEGDENGKNIVF